MLDAILGTWIFIALIVLILSYAMRVSAAVQRFLGRIQQPASVDQTLLQMFGDVNVQQDISPYAAAHEEKRLQKRHLQKP